MRDWFSILCIGILCVLALYCICELPTYPPIHIEEGFQAVPLAVLPRSIECTMTSLNARAGFSTAESGGQTWLCKNDASVQQLLKGDRSFKPARPYISPNDIACVAQDASGTLYTCLDRSKGIDDSSASDQYDNYTTSCNNYFKSYTDISNSLTTLIKMKLAVFDGSENLVKSMNALNEIYTKSGCATITSGPKLAVCNGVTKASANLLKDIERIVTLSKPVENAAAPARASRTNMVNALNDYRCGYKIPS